MTDSNDYQNDKLEKRKNKKYALAKKFEPGKPFFDGDLEKFITALRNYYRFSLSDKKKAKILYNYMKTDKKTTLFDADYALAVDVKIIDDLEDLDTDVSEAVARLRAFVEDHLPQLVDRLTGGDSGPVDRVSGPNAKSDELMADFDGFIDDFYASASTPNPKQYLDAKLDLTPRVAQYFKQKIIGQYLSELKRIDTDVDLAQAYSFLSKRKRNKLISFIQEFIAELEKRLPKKRTRKARK